MVIFMRVVFESSGDLSNTMNWLDRVSKINTAGAVSSFGKRGTESLKAATPRATGNTAAGWKEQVSSRGDVVDVDWVNTAYPGLNVNMALLIELGHGTGTGGYVPPKPYIKQAMNPVWAAIDDKLIRELIK